MNGRGRRPLKSGLIQASLEVWCELEVERRAAIALLRSDKQHEGASRKCVDTAGCRIGGLAVTYRGGSDNR